jgi:hypothetical protein
MPVFRRIKDPSRRRRVTITHGTVPVRTPASSSRPCRSTLRCTLHGRTADAPKLGGEAGRGGNAILLVFEMSQTKHDSLPAELLTKPANITLEVY